MDAVRISWTPPKDAVSYKIYRETAPNVFTFLTAVAAPTTSGVDNDVTLALGNTYKYKVEVRNSLAELVKEAVTTVSLKNCTAMPITMTADTTLAYASSPYCLAGSDATISNPSLTVTLTIEPGVVILFGANRKLTIGQNAQLVSEGTAALPIIFTSSAVTPVVPAWLGVVVASDAINSNPNVSTIAGEAVSETKGTQGSSLAYSVVEYAKTGLKTARSVYVDSSTFRNSWYGDCANSAGGIHIEGPSASDWVVVKSSIFVNNLKTNCAGGAGDVYVTNTHLYAKLNTSVNARNLSNGIGGAFSVETAEQSTFFANSIYDAHSDKGGPCIGLSGGSKMHFIKNNYFSGTKTNNLGGCISSYSIVGFVIKNNTFETTHADTVSGYGGAIYDYGSSAAPTISNNIFKNTYAGGYGGAIYTTNPSTATTISDNVFINTRANTSAADGQGGAIYVARTSSSPLSITNNSFYGSYVQSGGSAYGGAIAIGPYPKSVTIAGNHFKNTWAASGGGAIYLENTPNTGFTFQRNNFVGTRKTSAAGPLNALHNAEDANYTVKDNWWGAVYAATSCEAVASNLCETTQAAKPTLTTNATAAWPLCCAVPTDPNCVGAATLPSYQACE